MHPTLFSRHEIIGEQICPYGEVRDFLAKYTQLIELSNSSGARVAIAPEFQGRVMTSSCDGLDGMSFGFVNREFIAAGNRNEHFNNYGGEERVWISPEGGQFSLWFKPGIQKQTLADWYTPAELNDGPWPVVDRKDNTSVSMAAGMKLQNTSGTRFDIEVGREVRLARHRRLQRDIRPARGRINEPKRRQNRGLRNDK